MFVVGLTGGIGSGKTAVSDHFQSLGITVVDADLVSREVVAPGEPALAQIAARHGGEILEPDGGLNRGRLRDIIFTDPAEKVWLEQLLHPLIRARIETRLREAPGLYCILSSPLLLETDQSALVDRILVVHCAPETQLRRVRARDGVSESQIAAIMAAQLPGEERVRRADDVLQNEGSLADLHHAVAQLHERYLALAG